MGDQGVVLRVAEAVIDVNHEGSLTSWSRVIPDSLRMVAS